MGKKRVVEVRHFCTRCSIYQQHRKHSNELEQQKYRRQDRGVFHVLTVVKGGGEGGGKYM
jgi:hypothetical protein